MKTSRAALKRKKRYTVAKPHKTALKAYSARVKKKRRGKLSGRWKNFYFWMPFYSVFLLVLGSVFLGWMLHKSSVSDKRESAVQVVPEKTAVQGRSGGDDFLPFAKPLGMKMRKVPFLFNDDDAFAVAMGDSSVPAGYVDSFAKTEFAPSQPLWRRYAVSVPKIDDETPVIAVVIDDLGLNRKMTRAFIDLPAPLTLSFLTYADDLPEQTQTARQAGHELLVHTPMEPVSDNDAGPDALKAGMSEAEIRERLGVMLDAFSGYVGINNHMGSKFTSDRFSMDVIADEVSKRGLLFLDSLTSRYSKGKEAADAKGVPYAVRNVFLDNARDPEKVMHQLHLLEKAAERNKTAVGIGHPHRATMQALKAWIPEVEKKGFVLVPISAAVERLMKTRRSNDVFTAVNHSEEE